MTNQGALNTMCMRCRVHDLCQGTGCTPRQNLQELVDKATPKKSVLDLKFEPVIDENGAYIDADMIESVVCPICGNWLDFADNVDNGEINVNYCDGCGQAIDWSEETSYEKSSLD